MYVPVDDSALRDVMQRQKLRGNEYDFHTVNSHTLSKQL